MLGLAPVAAGVASMPAVAASSAFPSITSAAMDETRKLKTLFDAYLAAISNVEPEDEVSEFAAFNTACDTVLDRPVRGWSDLVALAAIVRLGADEHTDGSVDYGNQIEAGEMALANLIEGILELGGVA